jgi:hypothetical protein
MAVLISDYTIEGKYNACLCVDGPDLEHAPQVYFSGVRTLEIRNHVQARTDFIDFTGYVFTQEVRNWFDEVGVELHPLLCRPVSGSHAYGCGYTPYWAILFATEDDAVLFRMRWMSA